MPASTLLIAQTDEKVLIRVNNIKFSLCRRVINKSAYGLTLQHAIRHDNTTRNGQV